MNLNNSRNQEGIQTSKPKRKNKRELPPLPVPEDTTSITQTCADASNSEISFEPNDIVGGQGSKRKSKKGKSKGDTQTKTESRVEDTEDKLLHEYQQQIALEEEKTLQKTKIKTEEQSVSKELTLNNDVGKKKKKKLKSVVTESDVGLVYLFYN